MAKTSNRTLVLYGHQTHALGLAYALLLLAGLTCTEGKERTKEGARESGRKGK